MPDLQKLLHEIQRLDNEATPGPWYSYFGGNPGDKWMSVEPERGSRTICTVTDDHKPNAVLIAQSRTALPQLAAVIRRLRECAQTLTEDNNDASDYASGIHEAVECFEHIIADALGDDDAE